MAANSMTNTCMVIWIPFIQWMGRLFSKKAPIIPPHFTFFKEPDHLAYSASMRVGMKGVLMPDKNKDHASQAEALMDALKVAIRKAAIQRYSKPQLITVLKTVLHPYAFLRHSMLEVAVLLFIGRAVNRDCVFDIRPDELRTLWA